MDSAGCVCEREGAREGRIIKELLNLRGNGEELRQKNRNQEKTVLLNEILKNLKRHQTKL